MKLKLTIDMDNAAFADDGANGRLEVARILNELSDALQYGMLRNSDSPRSSPLADANGNTVGCVTITGRPARTATPASRGTATRRSAP